MLQHMIHWYLVHTKPRQERVALENLTRQGYSCFLPLIGVEKLRQNKLQVVQEALFPRYLFIQLDTDPGAQSWSPIRSTLGVSKLVTFGQLPAKVRDDLVEEIRSQTQGHKVITAFNPGDEVLVTDGPFQGLDALYQTADGEGRVMVLLNILSKDVRLSIEPRALRKRK